MAFFPANISSILQNPEKKSGNSSNIDKIENWIANSDPVYCDPSEIGYPENTYKVGLYHVFYGSILNIVKALSAPVNQESLYMPPQIYKPLSDIGQNTRRAARSSPNPNSSLETQEMRRVSQLSESHRQERVGMKNKKMCLHMH